MHVDEVAETSSQHDIGAWDSLAAVHLTLALEDEFETTFSPEEAVAFLSVDRVLAAVRHRVARNPQ